MKAQGVIRTRNNPVADYAEWLVSQRLGLTLMPNSYTGHDAVGPGGERFQIKSRCIDLLKDPRQLGLLRNLATQEFDFLIGVLFSMDFSTVEAYKIPHDVIGTFARYSAYQNGHILHLRGGVLEAPGVEDISTVLKR